MLSLSLTEKSQQEICRPLHYLPLVSSPALYSKYQNFRVDELLIMARTISSAALSALAITGLYFICPPAALLITKYEVAPIIGTVILTLALSIHEVMRAQKSADQRAVENYCAEAFPSKEAMNHICSSPKAFQLLLNRGESLDKTDESLDPLSKKIFNYLFASPKVQDMFIDHGGDLFKIDASGTSLFMNLVDKWSTTLLDKILKSERAEIQESLTALKANPIEVWKKVRYSNTLQLLCQHGFDINAQDAQGMTPLMHWAKKADKNLCIAALNAGADPLLTSQEDERASELIPLDPGYRPADCLLNMILLQAEKEFKHEPVSLPKDKSCLALLPWKPLITKTKDPFNAFTSRVLRICAVATYCLCLIAISGSKNIIAISTANISLNILGGLGITFLFLNLVELWRGHKEAQRKAVIEYLKTPVPSEKAMNTICQSKEAALMLIESLPKGSPLLNKLFKKTGETLLAKATPEVFKLLVDHGANILAGFRQNGFLHATEQETPDLLQHIADKNLTPSPNEISKELQVKMWRFIQSKETADFLKKHGFDPNLQDKNGNTPLMCLISEHTKNLKQAALLIAAGADASKIESWLDPQTFALLKLEAEKISNS